MNWKFFIGACILAVGLLMKAGAPLVPVALGIVGAAFFNWRKHQHGSPASNKKTRA
jgi:hypothetical protein